MKPTVASGLTFFLCFLSLGFSFSLHFHFLFSFVFIIFPSCPFSRAVVLPSVLVVSAAGGPEDEGGLPPL